MTRGVYSITNKINNKRYIGISCYIETRWHRHKWALNNDRHENIKLLNAWRKYGEDNFIFEIIEEINDIDDLSEREKYYISSYDSFKNGYNRSLGGDGTIGFVADEERLKVMSEKMKGNKYSLGKKRSKETIEKLSKSLKRVKNQDRYKDIARENLKRLWKDTNFREKVIALNKGNKYALGRKLSEEQKSILSQKHSGKGNPFYNKTHNEKTKNIMSIKGKEKWSDKEYKEKMSKLKNIYMQTDEYKEKMSLKSRGENNGKTTLKEVDVIKIRLRYLNGNKPKNILKDYPNLTKSGLQKIYLNSTWKHIPNDIKELECMLINYQS